MIRIDNVSHSFGERKVLHDLTLSLEERRIAVVGANGSGKSTFVRLLNGLQLPSEGRVLVDGLDTRTNAGEIRRKVGFVFQNPDNQIVFPIVEEDLAFGLKNLRIDKAEIDRKITRILDTYGLGDFRKHPTHLLSGGQKQLIAISSVLVMEPKYLVFDEPTTLLDLRNKRRITRAIHDLPQTAIVASHDLELLAGFDRVIVMDEGRVVMDDAPDRAIAHYRTIMT